MDELLIVQEASRIADVTVFRLNGPLTLSTMFSFQTGLRDPALKGAIIDLSGVPYIDSAGLGVLLTGCKRAKGLGHCFALSGISPKVQTVLQMTQTDKVLTVFATREDAENSLGIESKR